MNKAPVSSPMVIVWLGLAACGMAASCSRQNVTAAPPAKLHHPQLQGPSPTPHLAGATVDLGIAVTTLAGGSEPVLVALRTGPYPTRSSLKRADDQLLGERIASMNTSVLDEVLYSFRGKSWAIRISDKILFPDPGTDLGVSPEWTDDESTIVDDRGAQEDVGVAEDPNTGRVAVAFGGSDGEGSYYGSVIFKDGKVIGGSMKYLDGDRTAEDFARISLKTFRKL